VDIEINNSVNEHMSFPTHGEYCEERKARGLRAIESVELTRTALANTYTTYFRATESLVQNSFE